MRHAEAAQSLPGTDELIVSASQFTRDGGSVVQKCTVRFDGVVSAVVVVVPRGYKDFDAGKPTLQLNGQERYCLEHEGTVVVPIGIVGNALVSFGKAVRQQVTGDHHECGMRQRGGQLIERGLE